MSYRAARARLESLGAIAHARGDSGLEMVLELRRANGLGFVENAFDTSQALARKWIPFIRARHDTLSWCWALRTVGYADLMRERYHDAERSYATLLRLALRSRLETMEGYARLGTSFLAIQNGHLREAERGYRLALVRLAQSNNSRALHTARAGLAHALQEEGKSDEARREEERVLAETRATHDRFNAAAAINDLGALEFQYGDPSRAESLFRAAVVAHHELRNVSYELNSRRNVGLCAAALGRGDEAVAIFDSVATAAAAVGAWDIQMRNLVDVGNDQRATGHPAQAESTLRRAVAMRDSGSVEAWAEAVVGLAGLESASGRADEARRRLRDALASEGAGLGTHARTLLLGGLGAAEIAAGDPTRALAPLRENAGILRHRGGLVGARLSATETTLAEAFLAMGLRDSGITHYGLAAEAWETSRAAPNDLAWRAAFDDGAAKMFVRYAELLLDPARGSAAETRAAAAFAAMQKLRSRTLEDALRGAEGRAALPRVSLATLQRVVLRPGEVLLDLYVTSDTSLAFALSRTAIRAAWAPGRTRLGVRLRRFRELLAAPDADPGGLDRAAAGLGADLLGPLADALRGAHTVLVSAGNFDEFPLGMLRLPGEAEPLAVARRVALVPSATLLASGREPSRRTAQRRGLTALSRWTDAEGRRLEGVEDESRWLSRRFPSARVRGNDGRRPLEEMLADLGSPEVLHVSSHTRNPAAAPWRAGFLLGRGAGEDAYLTAARVAKLRSPARVCVLAGCTSAGAMTGPEGMPNLAAAWLTAGARAVIATLWRVDDRVTAELVEDFYAALASGRTVAEALAAAQRQVRDEPGHAAPRYWAGFVLLGDPETCAVLENVPGASGERAK